MTVVVEIKNLDRLQRALRDYEDISRPILQKAMEATNAVFAKHTLKGDPVPYRTGFLLASFRHKVGDLQATWRPTVKYAGFVEYGTSMMAARPYMGQILQKSKSEVDSLFDTALERITEQLAG